MTERRPYEVAHGKVDVGRRRDHDGVLPTRFSVETHRRLPAEEQPRRVVGAG
jgi:hypothetical protein